MCELNKYKFFNDKKKLINDKLCKIMIIYLFNRLSEIFCY